MLLANQIFKDSLPTFTPAHSVDTLWLKFLDLHSNLLSLIPITNRKDTKPSYLRSVAFRLALTEKYSSWSKYRNSANLLNLSKYRKAETQYLNSQKN